LELWVFTLRWFGDNIMSGEVINHQLIYALDITFKKDDIQIICTGDGILELKQLKENAIIRHKHTKLINNINDCIRQYIKDNQ
jgi:hypothetical protein